MGRTRENRPMLAACGNRNNFLEKAVHGASGVRILPRGEAKPDQPETFYFHYISLKLLLVLVRKNGKFLGGTYCYLHIII